MCCPMKQACRSSCEVGMSIRTVNGQERLTFQDRRCCTQCNIPADGSDATNPTTNYELKVQEYQKGLYHQNPCNDCGTYDHCGDQIRKGFTQD